MLVKHQNVVVNVEHGSTYVKMQALRDLLAARLSCGSTADASREAVVGMAYGTRTRQPPFQVVVTAVRCPRAG